MGPVLTMMGLLSILGILSAAVFSVDHVHAELQVPEIRVSYLGKGDVMQIKIGSNPSDLIFLAPASNIPGKDGPCLFSGEFLENPGSSVAVSGCMLDETISLNISSPQLPTMNRFYFYERKCHYVPIVSIIAG